MHCPHIEWKISEWGDEMSGNGKTSKKWLPDGWLLFAVVLLVAVISPVFIYQYLYHDDWQWFGGRCPGHWFYLLGRPLGNAVLCAQFHSFSQIGDAYLARLETVGAVLLFLIAMYRFMCREGLPRQLSVFVAFGVAVLPGFLVVMFWLGAAYIAFSLLFSVYAALACQKALHRDSRDRSFYLLILGAGASELVSAYIYQTGAMMFLVLCAVTAVCVTKAGGRSFLRSFLVYGGVFAGANLVYFSWFKYFVADNLAKTDPTRGTLFHDLAGALEWFAHDALPRAMQLWFAGASTSWVAQVVGFLFVASFVGFSLVVFREAPPKRRAGLVAVYGTTMLLLGLGCFLPMIASNFRMPVFRLLIPLSAFVVATTSIHLYLLGSRMRYTAQKIGYLMAVPMVGIGFVAHQMLLDEMVMPRAAEVQQLRQIMHQAKVAGHEYDPVHIISVPDNENPWKTDEIGALTASFVDDHSWMINYIRDEAGLPRVKVTHSSPGEAFDPKGKVVADLSALQYR
jgi:hypothetical protein